MARLGLSLVALGCMSLWVAGSLASAPWSFRLDHSMAAAGETVSLTVAGAPGRRVRVYLVPVSVSPRVRSQLDQRLQFLGQLRLDHAGNASGSFVLPSIQAGRYSLSAWCAACASTDRSGQLFRKVATLSIRPSSVGCPVTSPSGGNPPGLEGSLWYGNAFLWTALPDGGRLVPQLNL
jgi:hypothetical protein